MVYPHLSHLPFAQQPLKSLYIFQRILTTILLIPYWLLYYSLFPSHKPRSSWSLRQIVYVNFTRRVYRVTEVAGVIWGARDPDEEPCARELKETRFEWAEALKEELRTGVVVGPVPFKRVGCFIWPKKCIRPIEPLENQNDIPIIGIFMHGGGYTHMSAHKKSRTSHIPRRLMKDRLFNEIYAVDYRPLQHAPFPAVIMDAAAVYVHVVDKYYGTSYINKSKPKPCKIILIGDSSGGNIVLALTRWIRDEDRLPIPDGLLLFSPSSDPSHAFPSTPSSYIPRPNAETDYLTDTPEPRALLQRTFLGFARGETSGTGTETEAGVGTRTLMEVVHSEYVSPASPRVLRRWGHVVDSYGGGRVTGAGAEGGVEDVEGGGAGGGGGGDDNGDVSVEAPSIPSHPQPKSKFPTLFAKFPKTMILIGDAERLTVEVWNLARAMGRDCERDHGRDGDEPSTSVGSGSGSKSAEEAKAGAEPASETGTAEAETKADAARVAVEAAKAEAKVAEAEANVAEARVAEAEKKGLVTLGKGYVKVRWIPDAVHDVFMIPPGWWDERVKDEVWEDVRGWVGEFWSR